LDQEKWADFRGDRLDAINLSFGIATSRDRRAPSKHRDENYAANSARETST
jgi:hypothetical protein